MTFRHPEAACRRVLAGDWFAALLFLLAYLCTNSYIYAWDDQHLEIPLLKHLIDPTLYKGDYYVEALARNFSSFLYPILAHTIKVSQIPATYLVLFLISRYMMFYWLYRLWQLLSGGDKFAAALAVCMFFLTGRTEEFLYRTFSHQEFSYIFMFGGFYYFYREHFLLAAFLFGLGANFHAIYCLFPMLYMLTYLVFCRRDLPLVLKTGSVFTLFALPFLAWQVPHSLAGAGAPKVPVEQWMPLYLLSCQQNFLFWTATWQDALAHPAFMLVRLEPYLFLLGLYAFLLVVEPRLRRDTKTRALIGVSYFMIVFSVYFSYIHPSRFVLDLNLLRNEQFVRLMLMGYSAIFACRLAKEGRPWQVLAAGLFLFFAGFGGVFFWAEKARKFFYVFPILAGIFALLLIKPRLRWPRTLMVAVPLAAAFVSFSIYHYQYLQLKRRGAGAWQFYRNWVDMQNYVRTHTPKDALILTPYDTETGGFRIFSERKVLVCYRDCGVIGFDYNAAVEWFKRVQDVKGFKYMDPSNIEKSIETAIVKYHVDYIVFMNYYQPGDAIGLFKKMYQNEVLSLYEVRH